MTVQNVQTKQIGRELDLDLDSGGFGRLDISDLTEPAQEEGADQSQVAPQPCDWCQEDRSRGGDYLVVADNRHFMVCPTCWGRSAAYVELRRDGLTHNDALSKLTPS